MPRIQLAAPPMLRAPHPRHLLSDTKRAWSFHLIPPDPVFLRGRFDGGGPEGAFERTVRLRYDYVGLAGDVLHEWTTGFVVEDWPQCVITAAHLFYPAGKPKGVHLDSPRGGGATATASAFAAYRPGKGPDLAVIVFNARLTPAGAGFDPATVDGVLDGRVCGYREASTEWIELPVTLGKPVSTTLRYEAATVRGMSGGPVFADRTVVGVHLAVEPAGSTHAKADVIDGDAWNRCMHAADAAFAQGRTEEVTS